jgi:HEAT repeat protein
VRASAAWALVLALPLGSACSRGGASPDDDRVAELERRVAILEKRLAEAPSEGASLDGATFDEIAQRLDSSDPMERLRAGRALGRRLTELQVDALRLLQEGSVRQREAVAVLLSQRATPGMASGLLAAHARTAEPRVRSWIVRALGSSGSAEAFGPLAMDLQHPDEVVRLAAVDALARLGDPRAAAPLAKLMATREGASADFAAGGMARLGDPVAAYLGTTWASHGPRERRVIITALERVSGPSVDAFLKERLEDPSALVALEAARVLGAKGDMSGRDVALERLKSEDPAIAQAARAALDAMEGVTDGAPATAPAP